MIKQSIFCRQPDWIKSVNRSGGFTLLEVVCSLALMGLVVVAALSFLGHALDFWEKSGRWGEDEQEIRLIDRNLANFSSLLFSGNLPRGEEQGFMGDDRSAEGLTESDNGLARIGLFWEATDKTLYLWKGSREDRTKIVGNIDRFELSYYQSGQGWVTSWDHQSPLPTHIRVNWSYKNKKEPPLMHAILGGRSIPAP